LRSKLQQRVGELPGLAEAIPQLVEAVDVRNALAHATPVRDGLHYRTKDRGVVNFFDVADLDAAAAQIRDASRTVNGLLYHDGGEAVRRYTRGR
jgi:hypothetical protein